MHQRCSWRDEGDLTILVADYRDLDDAGRADVLQAVVDTVAASPPGTCVLSLVDPSKPVTKEMHAIGMAAVAEVFKPRRTLIALVGTTPSAGLGVRVANQAAGGRAILIFPSEAEALAHFRRVRSGADPGVQVG